VSGTSAAPKTFTQKLLDVVERVGSKIPHPAVIFLVLIGIVVVLARAFWLLGASATVEVITPEEKAPES